ncbi:integrin alpha-PS1-like [Dermatophagoides pteronyssinus]|uniref:integrin alpha-PS1-like n=1 Tax=Dermatophagoides pteronyssinus TaxID=6956 RepID=UPI003F662F5E
MAQLIEYYSSCHLFKWQLYRTCKIWPTLILISSLLIQLISTFNLDINLPVYKFGPPDSYFGYSVAEHIIKRSSQSTPVLLVGAPRAQIGRIRTGALFKCDLNTRAHDCVNLYVDPDNSTFSENIDKEDQWLGVTVKSQGEGGYVMVCAHRYVLKGSDFRWGNGICYSLTQFLDYSRTYEPCRGRVVNLAHEQFGFCQAGTSGEITKNFEILIGSPGPYTWRGTVFSNNIRYSIKDDKTWYMGPVIEGKSPVDKYSYLGMSVTSGDFFGDDKIIIATGAPRSNGTGEVIFYSKDSGRIEFDIRGRLHGEQIGSSFGYSMASFDCDGDKHSDLAIGAPFYYDSNDNGGAVYIYRQKDLRIGSFDKHVRLTGRLESRFGFSIANAGDLNRDNFDDLAIGAPYDDNGIVYIYSGSQNGLKTEPSQVIMAKELPSPLNQIRTFGYSLSGNLDLDRNSYPDLLIGAYESDAIILLRSRPIIRIKTLVHGNMTQIDPNTIGCPEDPASKMSCFSVRPCFQFTDLSNNMNSLSKFALRYRIEAETFAGRQKYYRVIFRNSMDNSPNIVEKTISLDYGYTREYCTKELIYLKEKQDIQNKIAFKLSYSLKQTKPELPREGEPLPDINEYPILDQQEAQRIFYAKFNKDCGHDDICDSNLLLKAELLRAKKKKNENNYTMILDDENILVNISLLNRAEPAYDTAIIIDHSPNISYVGRKIIDDQVDCVPTKNQVRCELANPFNKGRTDFQLRFNSYQIDDRQHEFFISIKVVTSSNDISGLDNHLEFYTEIQRRAELELSGISAPKEIHFGGEIRGEMAMKFEDEIGEKIIHRYIVTNKGPLRAKDVAVLIDWPYQIDNSREFGKWILYILSKPSVTGQLGYCDLDSKYVNPKDFQNVKDDNENIRRRRNVIQQQQQQIRDKDGHITNVAHLTCGLGARCVKIRCWISQIEPNRTAVIHIRSRLWNATFIEDFSHFHHVTIQSKGRIQLNPLYNIIQDEHDDIFLIETDAYPDAIHKIPQASWWWYLLAIIIGLIILLLIISILCKTGFFKRDKGYHQVSHNDGNEIN